MQQCFEIASGDLTMCVWGLRPEKPVKLQNFCATHSFMFLEFVLTGFFTHIVKTALCVTTPTELFLIFKVSNTGEYHIVGWETVLEVKKGGGIGTHFQPLFLRSCVSSLFHLLDVVQFLFSLPLFDMYAVLYGTTLPEVTLLPNLKVALTDLQQSSSFGGLVYNPDIPALCVSQEHQVLPVDLLAVPEVTAFFGSTTPDPRLSHGGTRSLWDATTKNKFPVQNVRVGHLLHQKKTVAAEFKDGRSASSEQGAVVADGQFQCDL